MHHFLTPGSFHPLALLAAGQVPVEAGLNHYLLVSALLFAIGFFGVLLRRNTLIIYMCLELMLNASTLAAVAFSRFNGTMDGNIFVFFIITVAAAEVAVGLAIIVALFRLRGTVQTEELTALRN
jgi:NADH-quinone oxidoreductase subunit K